MTEPTTCPKCGGAMSRGFILDSGVGRAAVSAWYDGPPHASFWRGIDLPNHPGMLTATYRCGRCGFLESYARPEYLAELTARAAETGPAPAPVRG